MQDVKERPHLPITTAGAKQQIGTQASDRDNQSTATKRQRYVQAIAGVLTSELSTGKGVGIQLKA